MISTLGAEVGRAHASRRDSGLGWLGNLVLSHNRSAPWQRPSASGTTNRLATVAALLDAKLPDDTGVDSHNLLPAFLGEKLTKPIREATVHHAFSGKFAIRKGDWVLIAAPTGDDNGKLGEPDWFKRERGYVPHDHPTELFDLRKDLSEQRNLSADHPGVVAELTELLRKYVSEGRSTPGAKQVNDLPVIFDKPKR